MDPDSLPPLDSPSGSSTLEFGAEGLQEASLSLPRRPDLRGTMGHANLAASEGLICQIAPPKA
jgi:hypothetical protein